MHTHTHYRPAYTARVELDAEKVVILQSGLTPGRTYLIEVCENAVSDQSSNFYRPPSLFGAAESGGDADNGGGEEGEDDEEAANLEIYPYSIHPPNI